MVKRSFQMVTRDYAKRWGSMPQLPRPEYNIEYSIDMPLKRSLLKTVAS